MTDNQEESQQDKDFSKVVATINSCDRYYHIPAMHKLIYNFYALYKDVLDYNALMDMLKTKKKEIDCDIM